MIDPPSCVPQVGRGLWSPRLHSHLASAGVTCSPRLLEVAPLYSMGAHQVKPKGIRGVVRAME